MVSQWVCAHSTGVISVIWQKKKKDLHSSSCLLSVCISFFFVCLFYLILFSYFLPEERMRLTKLQSTVGSYLGSGRLASVIWSVSQTFTFVWNISANIYNLTHFVKILHLNSDPLTFPVKNWIFYHKKIHTDIYYININLCWNWQS